MATEQKRYWTSEGPASWSETPPMSGAMVFGLDLLIALLAAGALFLVGLQGIGGITHHDAVRARVTCIVICLVGITCYLVLAATLARTGRSTGAAWQVVLVLVAVVYTVVVANSFKGPYADDPRRQQPAAPYSAPPSVPYSATPSAQPTAATSARMICYSGGGCSINGTPVPGSP
jgi:small-conductance mechanosensitive channel